MSEITRDTVHHYAKLASLRFTDAEADKMASELGSILEYVDKIAELNLDDVALPLDLGPVMPRREDVVGSSLGQDAAVANAPDAERGFFLAPKVIKR